jgi:hypothetical protein
LALIQTGETGGRQSRDHIADSGRPRLLDLTVWQDESAMNAFRITQPHRDAMPKLLEWCDEAAVVHWNQQSAEVPGWETAERRMAESGRLTKVNHPSADQPAGRLDFIRKKA